MIKKICIFACFLGVVVFVAILGARATQVGLEAWFNSLRKPTFQPPSKVFPIVWTVMYTAIAIAGSLIYLSSPSSRRNLAIAAWITQMVFNAAWSELFFRYRMPNLALLDSIALLISIGIFCVVAIKVDRRAFNLFVPYFIWVAFATLLNLEIICLNAKNSLGSLQY